MRGACRSPGRGWRTPWSPADPLSRRRRGAPARHRGSAPAGELDAEVEIGGAVASRQGLNIPGPLASLPSVPEEDLELLRHGESIGVDMVALSFVQTPEDVEFVREHTRLPLIAKIEKPQAVDARGDPPARRTA